MSDYISREKFLAFPLRRNGAGCDMKHANPRFLNGIETAMEYAEALPAEDVAPILHARWIQSSSFENLAICSACRQLDCCMSVLFPRRTYKFCPNCGAKMDQDTEMDQAERQ